MIVTCTSERKANQFHLAAHHGLFVYVATLLEKCVGRGREAVLRLAVHRKTLVFSYFGLICQLRFEKKGRF